MRAFVLSSFFGDRSRDLRGAGERGRLPLRGRRADLGRRRASPARRSSTSSGSGPFLYAAAERRLLPQRGRGAKLDAAQRLPGATRRACSSRSLPPRALEAFLATDRGVFRTADAGAHWHPAGLEGKEVLLVATFPPPEPMTRGKKPRR